METAGSETRIGGRPSRLVNLRKHESELHQEDMRQVPVQVASVSPVVPVEAPRVEYGQPSMMLERVEVQAPVEPVDTKALELSIAADYTAASLGATMADLPARVENRDKLTAAISEAKGESPVDQIARTASEAIAAIRAATDPDDIAEQIESLRDFAKNIKANSEMPEMTELGETIEKFIAVAEKSTGVKVKKASVPVTKRAAAVTPGAMKVTMGTPAGKRVVTAKKPMARPATKPMMKAKVATKPAVRGGMKKSAKTTRKSLSGDDAALRQALRSVASMDDEPRTRKTRAHKKGNAKRFVLAFSCALLAAVGIIYLVGSNIPDVSIRVAAMQTGVEASYPSYIPRDFSLKDISSEDGKITLTFSGAGGASFTLIEEKSSWDSAALQRNYVGQVWGEDYTTTHEQGITIYMHGSSAAWVNGGVLYKINAVNNTLTKKQLRNIVTSM